MLLLAAISIAGAALLCRRWPRSLHCAFEHGLEQSDAAPLLMLLSGM
jgi:hypothetical protein